MTRSRTIGRTRRLHYVWLQRGLSGHVRWKAACRCRWEGPPRRYEARAWADGALHAGALNTRRGTGVGA